VIDTVGAVASTGVTMLFTSIPTLDVELLPARSVALLVMMWFAFERLVVSSVFVHDVVPPAGLNGPASTEILIDATPPASVEVPATMTLPAREAPAVGVMIVTVGGSVSRRPFFPPPPAPRADATGAAAARPINATVTRKVGNRRRSCTRVLIAAFTSAGS
jgi:hypothetical protein